MHNTTDISFLNAIEQRLQLHLPGQNAHQEMSLPGRTYSNDIPNDAKLASVLILLYPKDNQWYTALMKRTSRFGNDKHKGQISFPGGQSELNDTNKAATALREHEEEMGVSAKQVRIIGALSELYIPVSNFLVQPFVAYTTRTPNFIPDAKEVDKVIEVTLAHLLNKINRKRTRIETPAGITLKNVPYFDVKGHIVWGATAMITNEFITIIEEISKKTWIANPSTK